MDLKMKWALPVWEKGKEQEMNWFIRLRTEVKLPKSLLRIACCNLYRVFVNGKFICQGPARAGHHCYRVDEVELPEGGNLEIQVGAYNVNAFEYLAKTEGIIPAIESAHAIAYAIKIAPTMPKDKIIVVTLSGRGDKDCSAIARYRGEDIHE